jgi:hypothetical protein
MHAKIVYIGAYNKRPPEGGGSVLAYNSAISASSQYVLEHVEAANILATAGEGEMSEDVDAEDRCPHCRLAFEIIWVKFELVRTKTLAICPNCSQVQSVPATNNLAAVGAKLDRAPMSRLPRRWQVSLGSQAGSPMLSVRLSTSAGAIVLRWRRLKSAQ